MNDHTIRRYLVLLNLPNRFDEAQLKQAYRDISQVWHPDKHGHNQRLRDKAESIFKEVNAAYQFFKDHMQSGSFEFNETQTPEHRKPFEPDPEMDEILRVVREELKKQYEMQILDLTQRYRDEVADLRHKHDEYISRITRSHQETKAQYEERVRRLSASLDGANTELYKEKAKADQLQKIVERSFFSLNAVRNVFRHGIAEPIVATARISADFVQQSRKLLIRLVQEHMPEKFDRVLILSTVGFMSVVILLVLAVITPSKLLIAIACTFVIVASSMYIAAAGSRSKTEESANHRGGPDG